MKKRMSVGEFRDYCDANKFSSISYWAENQRDFDTAKTCRVRLAFPQIVVLENPDFVYLVMGKNSVMFTGIRYIDVDTDSSILGSVFVIHCRGDEETGKSERSFTLVAKP